MYSVAHEFPTGQHVCDAFHEGRGIRLGHQHRHYHYRAWVRAPRIEESEKAPHPEKGAGLFFCATASVKASEVRTSAMAPVLMER